ncbi:MAG: hypothetical protein A2W03_06745 [Candidatus Aminicenantes bacterium RBG_16_63_16]|nr:MAG: hypothetical protein A2W03_06745 [Candidatus Aminicenantes bacterium RBG_16_63_16]
MYLGIDFLIGAQLEPFVIEVNVGLPGGAEEYDRAHRVFCGWPSGIFTAIEDTSKEICGRPFAGYLESLPFLPSLKELKLWMDGQGPFPAEVHPALRLEDKWVQYQVLRPVVPLPETIRYEPGDPGPAEAMLAKWGRLVLKRRLGRGGRGFRVIGDLRDLPAPGGSGDPLILQRHVASRVGGYAVSIRAVAFGGRFICAYANLAARDYSNHGILAHISEGNSLGLSDQAFRTVRIDERSWEAKLWFGDREPAYLRHNLHEDEVAAASLLVPHPVLSSVQDTAVRIERFYEGLDFSSLPQACFEDRPQASVAGRVL